jgi:hypothetical protein
MDLHSECQDLACECGCHPESFEEMPSDNADEFGVNIP